MAVLLTNGAVMLQVPKTGSTWAAATLRTRGLTVGEIGPKHMTVSHLRSYPVRHPYRAAKAVRRHGPGAVVRATRGPTFCFVRHPVDWYESWWHYMERIDWHDWGAARFGRRWHPLSTLLQFGGRERASLDDFVAAFVTAHPGYLGRVFAAFTAGAAFVGRQERLEDDLATAVTQLGLAWEPGVTAAPLNVSQADEGAKLSAAVVDLVHTHEAALLTRYGYERRSTGTP